MMQGQMLKGLVSQAYQKLMQGMPLTEEEELALEESEYQARLETQGSEKEKRFLMDPNKAKGLSEVERRMRMARVHRGVGGGESFLGGGANIRRMSGRESGTWRPVRDANIRSE